MSKLIPHIPDGDWVALRRGLNKLASIKFGPGSSPTFTGLTLSGLTASRLIWANSSKALASKDLIDLVAGTADEINIVDDGSGGVTIGIIDPLIVGKGGIGVATLTDHGILLGSGTGAVTPLGVASNGQIPIGSVGADPVLAEITGTSNQITSTSGAGSIILSLPQNIHTGASPAFTGLTLSGLTASRLIASDGSKALGSVTDLTSWIAGTTDHISVTNDGDGTVTLNLDTNTQTLLGSFNGIFLEKMDFTISEAAGTVTGSLEQDSGGDLLQRFSDGYTTLDCTPALTIDLTVYVGTNAVPKQVFVYILQSAKTVMVASNSGWPATEHIRIANLLLKSATTTGTDGGALVNRNWNNFAFASDLQGHVTHIEERIRQEPSQWNSGIALTLKASDGSALATGNSSTAIEIVTTAGTVYQLHKHTFPAFDMYTTGTDDVHVVNQPTDEGGAYETTAALVTDVTHYDDGSASGVAIGTNKYFNLVIWGVQNRSGEASHVMINLPTSQYTTEAAAIADANGTSVYDIPGLFKGMGFLIARLTFRLIAGPQWTYIAQEDLRGQIPPISAGVSVTATDHALLANLTFATAGHTGFQAQGDVLDDLNTLGAVGANSEFLVGTGAGALAWENASTARTSIGLGNVSNVATDDTAYNATSWNANTDAATKNVIRDKVETMDTAIGSNTTHRGSDGSDHSIVGSNTTAIGLNTTHRGSDGSDHSFLDQAVTIASTPTFAGLIIADGGTIGQSAGPLLTFDDTNNYLGITGCKVGIGTDTPQELLHVSAGTNARIEIENTGDTAAVFKMTNTAGSFGFLTNEGKWRVYDYSATAYRLALDATGKFGVGAALPVTLLTVEGTLTLKEQASADGDTATYGQMWVKSGTPNTLWFTNDAGGDYQIGGVMGSIVMADGGTIGQAAGPLLTFNDAANVLKLSGGYLNVFPGINLTAKFFAANDDGYRATIYVVDDDHVSFYGWDENDGGVAAQVDTWIGNATAVATALIVKADGKVGAGVQPVTKLTVEGTLTLKEQASADGDTATYGQMWVKNTTPNELWFTGDTGVDLRIAPQDLQTTASPLFARLNIQESATSGTIDSGWGQLWVKNTVPTELWFRDGAGVDHQIAYI